ncbi:MAG TPA: SIMPL domain-containing protein, partial [Gemmatales bacterium]|nr:SIMPL domain-containing protein [Gemmatales bacterium]
MQRRGAKKADPKNKQPDPIVVTAMLKADVPLKAATAEELLLLGHTLQDKIKNADLGGLKETEKLSPKDEELAEEMQEMNRMMAESGEPRRGEPSFMYVYKISPADHDKALKEAFTRASAQAGKLAAAAGVELGGLHTLHSNNQAGAADYMNDYYDRASRMMMMREAAGDSGDKDDSKQEAVGMNPTKVSFKVSVNVSFLIKAKK